MVRRIEKFQVIRMFIAFVLATLVFIGFFVFVNLVSYSNYINSVKRNNLILEAVVDLESANKNLTCSGEFIGRVSDKLDVVSRNLALLEIRWGKDDFRVIEQKKFYSELEYRHFKIIESLNNECGISFISFFFFYSNIPPFDDLSERVSFILQTFKAENSEKVMIYSFDYNLNSSLINNLKKEYNILSAPEIIFVDTGESFVLLNIKEIEQYLD